jgi:hypothetical protein
VWDELHLVLLERLRRSGRTGLVARRARQPVRHRRKGRRATGPTPADRGRPDTKRRCATDAGGTPLGVTIPEASRHDGTRMALALDAIPGVRSGKPGRPRTRPAKLRADEGCDGRRCRAERRARSITPRIARRGVETSARLGRHRVRSLAVERTSARSAPRRRLATRHERSADIHMAPTKPAAAIITMNEIRRLRWALAHLNEHLASHRRRRAKFHHHRGR